MGIDDNSVSGTDLTAPLHPIANNKLNKNSDGLDQESELHTYVAPRVPRNPAEADEAAARSGIGRSDRVVYVSVALISAMILFRVRYPEYAKGVATELRFLLALFVSCFVLGISGWFQSAGRDTTKMGSLYTVVMLAVLVGMWEVLLSGNLPSMIGQAVAALAGTRLPR